MGTGGVNTAQITGFNILSKESGTLKIPAHLAIKDRVKGTACGAVWGGVLIFLSLLSHKKLHTPVVVAR